MLNTRPPSSSRTTTTTPSPSPAVPRPEHGPDGVFLRRHLLSSRVEQGDKPGKDLVNWLLVQETPP